MIFQRPFILASLCLFFILSLFLLYKELFPSDEEKLNRYLTQANQKHGLDPLLVRALIWKESRFNPLAFGQAQERGLMQITPIAAQDWAKAEGIKNFNPEDLFKPHINIQAGCFYLAQAFRRWEHVDDPIPFALAEYNAGRSHALRWVDPDQPTNAKAFYQRITFPTTSQYIQDIQKKYLEYRSQYWKNRWFTSWITFRHKLQDRSIPRQPTPAHSSS